MRKRFDQMAATVTKATGSPLAFVLAVLTVVVWAVLGPAFHFSDTWQLVCNTATTVITYLMVFVIQAAANRDIAAIQAKLDEVLRAIPEARNELMGIEQIEKTEEGKP